MVRRILPFLPALTIILTRVSVRLALNFMESDWHLLPFQNLFSHGIYDWSDFAIIAFGIGSPFLIRMYVRKYFK